MTESRYVTYRIGFWCPACETEFDADWLFGDKVTCPACKASWETDYDENEDGFSVWIDAKSGVK